MTPKETYAMSLTGAEELLDLIGDPPITPDGVVPHPDEWLPRARTWHFERQNWANTQAKQTARIMELDSRLRHAEATIKSALDGLLKSGCHCDSPSSCPTCAAILDIKSYHENLAARFHRKL